MALLCELPVHPVHRSETVAWCYRAPIGWMFCDNDSVKTSSCSRQPAMPVAEFV
jgi:hypothetical protein